MPKRKPTICPPVQPGLCCAAIMLLSMSVPTAVFAQGIQRASRVGSIGINRLGQSSPSQTFLEQYSRFQGPSGYGGGNLGGPYTGPLSAPLQSGLNQAGGRNTARNTRSRHDAATALADPSSQLTPSLSTPPGRRVVGSRLAIPIAGASGEDVLFSLYQQYHADRHLGLGLGDLNLESTPSTFGSSVNPEVGATLSLDALNGGLMVVPRRSPPDLERPARLGSVVQRLLDDRSQNYIRRGWEAFRQAQYRRAADMFALADVVAQDDPETRAQVKLGQMFSAVALHQYAQALNALRGLLSPDPKTNAVADPLIFARYPAFSDMYPDARKLEDHRGDLARYSQENGDPVSLLALRAVVLWAQPEERGRSLLFADRVASAGEQAGAWVGLKTLLQDARAHEQARTGAAHDGATDNLTGPAELPW